MSISIFTHFYRAVKTSSPEFAEYLYLTTTREVPIGIYTEHCGVDVGIYTERYGVDVSIITQGEAICN